jgi:inorganic pyrophosphatase
MYLTQKAHPWHGVSPGDKAPEIITSYVEIVPSDTVKYEIDKRSGFLKIDRPQKFSNMIPTLYGFIPQSYCADRIADYSRVMSGKTVTGGDRDPLDICILSERTVSHGDVLVDALSIGGFRMIDGGEADDKIIAVMKGDEFYQQWRDVSDCPVSYINRLKHYFLTYKHLPEEQSQCEITQVYGRDEAHEVIRRAMADYQTHFGGKLFD